jgi:hypothetical protein
VRGVFKLQLLDPYHINNKDKEEYGGNLNNNAQNRAYHADPPFLMDAMAMARLTLII